MGWLSARILDFGLNVLVTEADRLDLCGAEPADFAAATGRLSLGQKADVVVGAPVDAAGSGRKVTVAAISGGVVTADGEATHWAISDSLGKRLLAAGALGGAQKVVAGNTFSLDMFDVVLGGVAGGVRQ